MRYYSRCSPYRGSTVEFTSCLNLSNPQFIASSNPNAAQNQQQQQNSSPFRHRSGPHPAIQAPPGQQGASGFRPAQTQGGQVHIMSNPHRGRGAMNNHPNGTGRGGHGSWQQQQQQQQPRLQIQDGSDVNGNGHTSVPASKPPRGRGDFNPQVPRGPSAPRGGFVPRGRGFNVDRGRGGPFRGFRGRGGRGQAPAVPS